MYIGYIIHPSSWVPKLCLIEAWFRGGWFTLGNGIAWSNLKHLMKHPEQWIGLTENHRNFNFHQFSYQILGFSPVIFPATPLIWRSEFRSSKHSLWWLHFLIAPWRFNIALIATGWYFPWKNPCQNSQGYKATRLHPIFFTRIKIIVKVIPVLSIIMNQSYRPQSEKQPSSIIVNNHQSINKHDTSWIPIMNHHHNPSSIINHHEFMNLPSSIISHQSSSFSETFPQLLPS